MPEIGTTLREARIRQRIDISEIESATKIRAKYLRALENEEWNLLPGPAYVKSFLKTYADAIGLDGRLLVEEYKLRHERLSDIELQPIAPPRVGGRRGRRGGPGPRRRGIPRGWLVAIVVLALLGALYALGRNTDNTGGGAIVPSTTTQSSSGSSASSAKKKRSSTKRSSSSRRRAAASRTVALRVVPSGGQVYVCLMDARGRRLIPGVILGPGQASRTFRSTRFRVTLGNGNARLVLNGRPRTVPQTTAGIGYSITRKQGRRVLPPGQRPTCG